MILVELVQFLLPDHYAMILHKKLNEMLSDEQFFNNKDDFKNLMKEKVDDDNKLNILLSNFIPSDLLFDSINLFSIF